MAGGGRLLATASLPSGINCVALDAGEHAVYAGGSDGAVYEISLVGSGPNQPSAAAVSTSSSTSAAVASLGYLRMEGHSRAVNALAMSLDGETMVSGSDDGTACVWDLRSRQVSRGALLETIHPIQDTSSAIPLHCRQAVQDMSHLSPPLQAVQADPPLPQLQAVQADPSPPSTADSTD